MTRWTRLRARLLYGLRAIALVVVVAALLGGAAFLLLDRHYPFPFDALSRPSAVVVSDRDGRPLRMFLPGDQKWRLPVDLDELPDELIRSLVAVEDRRFYRHPGVDPLAVLRATVTNLRAGRVVSGASTIPMQLARMTEPKSRTLGGKLREAFRALQLTRHRSKAELLEAYLNLAPYGGNLEGVGAAAWFYFGKSPDALSTGEIALLVALPRSPNAFDPTRHPEAASAARASVLHRLDRLGELGSERLAEILLEPLPARRIAAPMEAPHLARELAGMHPGRPRLRSTIDRRQQAAAETIVRGRIGELRSRGIGNAAVVVIENESRGIRALVGSASFLDPDHQGQVNGASARRSPGSTLKPFLYAMALDDGFLVPDSYLLDIPTDFSGYVAENYDGIYRGRITAREALRDSLNSPAVRLLSRVGLSRFLDSLHRGGLTSLDRSPGSYGLPLILGAGEVTLVELANLYADLATGGSHRAVRWLEDGDDSPVATDRPLFSEGAAALVTEMLTEVERPDLPGSWKLARDVPAVAWKTGTSYGHRDAWAVGSSERFTIGVWVGNFDGTPAKGISGATHAGPLLFEVFRALDRDAAAPGRMALRWHTDTIELCALSHDRPTPFCPRRVLAKAARSRSRLQSCAVHRRVFVDDETGRVLNPRCLADRPHHAEVVEQYPPELVAWWRAQGRPLPQLPTTSEECGEALPPGHPSIVAPDPSTPYRVRRDTPAEFQKIPLVARLAAGDDGDDGELFWYQDGKLVATAAPDAELFVRPVPGAHRLVVVDSAGRSDSVTYRVE